MSSEPTKAPQEHSTEDLRERAVIDRSTKFPVLFFLTSGLVWLLIAVFLGLIASVQQHSPGITACSWLSWMNFGRLQPAFVSSLVYGWGFQAAIAISLWIMARLCRTPLKNPVTLVVIGHFWNFGVLLGVLSIFSGNQAPGEWLEMGRTSGFLLFICWSLLAVWMVIMYVSRPKDADYVSQWYILGATFWFPWLYLTASLFTSPAAQSGVHAAATAAWYSNSLVFLFFVPVALGASYYLIPKIVGRAIHSYHLAIAGFWSLALFGGWTGMQKLIGGPLPTWMPAASSAAQVFLLIPVICVAANHFMTVRGQHGLVAVSPTLRFVFAGAVFYVGSHLVAAFNSLMPHMTQFTAAWDGFVFLSVYGFFSLTAFGAIYFIMPRLTGCEWLSPKFIRAHLWLSVYGSGTIAVMLVLCGLFQANSINTWSRGFIGVVENTRGFHVGVTIGWLLVIVSNIAFFLHFILIALRLGRRSERATLLHSPADYDHAEVMITTEGAEA